MLRKVYQKITKGQKSILKAVENIRFKLRLQRVKKLNYGFVRPGLQRILIWAPEAGLHAHYHACCLVAQVLQDAGHEVFMVRCYQQIDRCLVKGARRVHTAASSKEIKKICMDCFYNSCRVQDAYGLNFLDLRSLENQEHQNRYNEALKNLKIAQEKYDLQNFTFEGMPLGKMCGYEVRLEKKSLHLNETREDISELWAILIRSAIKSYLFVQEANQKLGLSNLVYFNDYSINLAARFALESKGGRAVMVTNAYHLGVDRSRLVFNSQLGLQTIFTDCMQWSKWKNISLPSETIKRITDDAIYRFSGRSAHTYSPPATRSNIIDSKKRFLKRVVIYTSSPDETACLAVLSSLGLTIPPVELTFGSTCENCHEHWLSALKKFACGRPEIEFIVRVHPREGANKREPGESEHLKILRKSLEKIPENFYVHWPESSVSSYDLGESADLVLTSWSTIGIEMARLGVPVLACAKGVAGYPVDNFQYFEKKPEKYFQKINKLLLTKPCLKTIRSAYRWWNLAYLSPSVDVSDVVPTSDFTALPKKIKPLQAQKICDSVLNGYNQQKELMEKWSKNPKTNEKDEREELKKSLRRIIRFFLTGIDKDENSPFLITFKNSSNRKKNPKKIDSEWISISFNSCEIEAFFDGKKLKRLSPLIRRLCLILTKEQERLN